MYRYILQVRILQLEQSSKQCFHICVKSNIFHGNSHLLIVVYEKEYLEKIPLEKRSKYFHHEAIVF